ncbi:hypothetical protein QTP86_025785 [Hemibagrus guttatus]|nr:hypothetical protein QTP86_025785 [Hemibagrus guttatus]
MASAPIPLTDVGSVTQVIPSSTVPNTVDQNLPQIRSPLLKFLKGEPKALGVKATLVLNIFSTLAAGGTIITICMDFIFMNIFRPYNYYDRSNNMTVQIMIGCLMILFGIMLAILSESLSVYTGIVFWGSLFHISAGSLAVAASNNLNSCVVKATLVLNIFSTIAAGGTIITICMDFIFVNIFRPYNYYDRSNNMGTIGVLLVFSLLQFCVSITVSAFTCKATCTNEPTVTVINMVPNPERTAPSAPMVNPFPPHHAQLGVNTMHAVAMGALPVENPPVYGEKTVYIKA